MRIGSLAGRPLKRGQLVGVRAGGHEVAALKPQRVPGRERGWAAGPFGLHGLFDAGPGAGVLRLEHRPGAGDEATHQHTVDQRDDQHHHDRGADEHRDLVVDVPAPDHDAGQELDGVHDDARRAHQQPAADQCDDEGAQIAQRARTLDAHHGRHLPLPRRGRDQHQHAGADRRRRRWLPSARRAPCGSAATSRGATGTIGETPCPPTRRCRSRWRR